MEPQQKWITPRFDLATEGASTRTRPLLGWWLGHVYFLTSWVLTSVSLLTLRNDRLASRGSLSVA